MVVTTGSVYGNEETNKVMLELAGYKTPRRIIKEFFDIRDDEWKNTKRLTELGVKYYPRLGELGVTEETFKEIFADVLDFNTKEDGKGTTKKSNSTSTKGA